MLFQFGGASTRVRGSASDGVVAVVGKGSIDAATLTASLTMGWCARLPVGACKAVVLELDQADAVSECAYNLSCGDCRVRDVSSGDVPLAVVPPARMMERYRAKSMQVAAGGAMMGAFNDSTKAHAWAKSQARLLDAQEQHRTQSPDVL